MCQDGFEKVKTTNTQLLQNISKNICDGGYDGKKWTEGFKKEFGLEIEITQRTDIKNGVVTKIRWIAERSFAWLDKCRRLSKNYERLFSSTKSMIILAFIRLLVRQLTGCCELKWKKKN